MTDEPSPPSPPTARRYIPSGAALQLWEGRWDEVLLSGPAGTGKSRACLEKGHAIAWQHHGSRGLVVRKTRKSITQSTMITFAEKVLPANSPVYFHTTNQEYRFPNGSVIVLTGCDDPEKIKSAEYDWAYINEATELEEHDWEMIGSRLRNGAMPYQQLMADCNPQGPTHWLRQRCLKGLTVMLESRYEDNPEYWDAGQGDWTEKGARYIARLDRLTGVRYKRLRLGIWAAAEGMVYAAWDPAVHLCDRFPVPADWRRFISIDFGYNNPFVAQWWALSPDGVLYRYREIYVTGMLVMDLAPRIVQLSEGEAIEAVICDHDAEDRATLERLRVRNIRARKNLSAGIQFTAERLKARGNGTPGLLFMRDSLVSPAQGAPPRDPALEEAGKPCCTEEEPEGYVWQKHPDGSWNKEQPLDENNHGLDATRYMVAHLDMRETQARYAKRLIG